MIADVPFNIFLPVVYMLMQNSKISALAAKPRLLFFSIYIILMKNSVRNTFLRIIIFLDLYLISQIIFHLDLLKLLENASLSPFHSYCY